MFLGRGVSSILLENKFFVLRWAVDWLLFTQKYEKSLPPGGELGD